MIGPLEAIFSQNIKQCVYILQSRPFYDIVKYSLSLSLSLSYVQPEDGF